MHALIIEDEPLISLAIQNVLAENGCTSFDLASSFEAAVAAKRCPDLITADVRLAPGSGIDAVEAICATQPVSVIFITGTAEEARQRCPERIVIEKPFTVSQVEEAVRSFVGSPPQPVTGSPPNAA